MKGLSPAATAAAIPTAHSTQRGTNGPRNLAGAGKVAVGGPGPRPSLMDIPDQPWQRRFGLGAPKLDAVFAADNTQPLVEYEPGHFVAVEDEL